MFLPREIGPHPLHDALPISFVAEPRAFRALGKVRLQLARVDRRELAIEICVDLGDRTSTRLNSVTWQYRMPSSARKAKRIRLHEESIATASSILSTLTCTTT